MNLFTEILSKVNVNKLEALFLVYKNDRLSDELVKLLGRKEIKIFFETFDCFQPRFNKIWPDKYQELKKIKELVLDHNEKIANLFKDIKVLCGIGGSDLNLLNIPIHLAIGGAKETEPLGWFSRFDHNIDVVLECPDFLSKKGVNFLVLILAHELFHIALGKSENIKNYIAEVSEQNVDILNIFSGDMSAAYNLEELLISTFVPEGYLAKHYFNHSILSGKLKRDASGFVDFISARQFFAYQIENTASDYVTRKKGIDREYLQILINLIKKTPNTV